MGIANHHSIHAVAFDGVAQRCNQGSLSAGAEVRSEATSAEIYPRHVALVGQRPGLSASTLNIADILGLIPLAGLDVDAMSAGIDAYAQQWADGAGVGGAGTHRKYSIVDGLAHLGQLSCDHRGDASIDFAVLPSWDGANDPLQWTDAASLPGSLPAEERHTIGGFTAGGVTFTGITNLSIDFGVQAQSIGTDSDQWDTHAGITGGSPIITASGIDIEWLKSTAIPLRGLEVTHANTAIYLRKRSATSFVADGTAQHIKFTACGLAVIEDVFTADGKESGQCSLRIHCTYDGSNAPITIDAAAAIT